MVYARMNKLPVSGTGAGPLFVSCRGEGSPISEIIYKVQNAFRAIFHHIEKEIQHAKNWLFRNPSFRTLTSRVRKSQPRKERSDLILQPPFPRIFEKSEQEWHTINVQAADKVADSVQATESKAQLERDSLLDKACENSLMTSAVFTALFTGAKTIEDLFALVTYYSEQKIVPFKMIQVYI